MRPKFRQLLTNLTAGVIDGVIIDNAPVLQSIADVEQETAELAAARVGVDA
jgi:hypothetical protein